MERLKYVFKMLFMTTLIKVLGTGRKKAWKWTIYCGKQVITKDYNVDKRKL